MKKKVLATKQQADMWADKYRPHLQIENDMTFAGRGIPTPTIDFYYDYECYFNSEINDIHLGIYGIIENYNVETEEDFVKAYTFVRLHETGHVLFTAARPYQIGIQKGCEEIVKFISAKVDKTTRRFRSPEDVIYYTNNVLPKMGVYIDFGKVQFIVGGIQNSLEDGRIERLNSLEYPGFEDLRVEHRGEFWENTEEEDNGIDPETNPGEKLRLISNNILSLAKCQLYQKGFALKYHGTPVMDEINSFMPNIARAYMSNKCKGMAQETIEISKKLAPLIYEVCRLSEDDMNMRKMLEELIKQMLTSTIESNIFKPGGELSEKDELQGKSGLPKSTFPVTDLVITLPDEEYDKLTENMKEGEGDGDFIIKREHPKEEEKNDSSSDGTNSPNNVKSEEKSSDDSSKGDDSDKKPSEKASDDTQKSSGGSPSSEEETESQNPSDTGSDASENSGIGGSDETDREKGSAGSGTEEASDSGSGDSSKSNDSSQDSSSDGSSRSTSTNGSSQSSSDSSSDSSSNSSDSGNSQETENSIGSQEEAEDGSQSSSERSEAKEDEKTAAESESTEGDSSSGERQGGNGRGSSNSDSDNIDAVLKAMKEAAERTDEYASKEVSNVNSCIASERRVKKDIIDKEPVVPEKLGKQIGHRFEEVKRVYKVTDKLPAVLAARGRALYRKNQRYFKSLSRPTVKNLDSGSVDPSRIYGLSFGDTEVFQKIGKDKQFNGCAYMLIDNSGSMHGNKRMESAKAGAVIEEGFREMFPLKIVAFDEDGPIIHEVIKNWNEWLSQNCCWNYALHGRSGAGNEDGYDIMVATKELLARPEQKKMLVVLSDGAPGSRSLVKKAVKEARRKGIEVYSIYFEEGSVNRYAEEVMKEMYERDYVVCPLSELDTHLYKLFQKFSRS